MHSQAKRIHAKPTHNRRKPDAKQTQTRREPDARLGADPDAFAHPDAFATPDACPRRTDGRDEKREIFRSKRKDYPTRRRRPDADPAQR
jgi:hypothetical protein